MFTIGFFLPVILSSAAGNFLVCLTVLRRARQRISRINLLIANLSFSDLFIALFNIPMNMTRILLDNWPFSEQTCKLGKTKVCVFFGINKKKFSNGKQTNGEPYLHLVLALVLDTNDNVVCKIHVVDAFIGKKAAAIGLVA